MGDTEGQELTIQLSAAGLERAASVEESKFSIIIGKSTFRIPRFQAAFISPRIHEILVTDSTVDSFLVEGVSSEGISGFDALSLINGQSISLKSSSIGILSLIGSGLGNTEIMNAAVSYEISQEELNISTAVRHLQMKMQHQLKCEEELEFISEHICDLGDENVRQVGLEILEMVLQHEKLQISSEDWLFEQICSLGSEYWILFHHVHCEYLSRQSINSLIDKISIESLDCSLWARLCCRLRCDVIVDSSDASLSGRHAVTGKTRKFETIEYQTGSPLNGLIWTLRRECSGNVYDRGVMSITSSGDSYNRCYNVTDENWTGYWLSRDVPNSWICFDFHETRISLSRYTIKSDNAGGYHLQSWVIEGSNDGWKWNPLHEMKNSQELNGSSQVKTFEVSCSSPVPFFRCLRLRQIGPNSSNNNHLFLTGIDFFGRIYRSTE
jgi:hypothetical protein